MNDLVPHHIHCPFCGENIELLVNMEDEGDTYIEDCSVCCSPISITVSVDESGTATVLAENDNET